MYRSAIHSLLFVLITYYLRSVVAFSSTTSSTADTTIIRTYTIFGNDIDDKNNIIHSVRPKPSDANVEEDEIEMYYPTTKRAFMFQNTHTTNANEMINDNMIVNIRETSFGCGKLGSTVWPSAIVLSCLLANDSIDLKDKKVIELGSGCGLPSTFLASTNGVVHSILATDYWEEEVTPDSSTPQSSSSTDSLYRNSALGQTTNKGDRLMAKSLFGRNLAYNIGTDENQHAIVKRLDWHDEMGIFKVATDYKPDVIIGSDLVYYPMDTKPLLQTIEMLCKAGGAKEALLIFPVNDGREALPDFRERLESGELGDGFDVIIDEIEMTDKWNDTDDDGEGDRYTFLRVRIYYNAR